MPPHHAHGFLPQHPVSNSGKDQGWVQPYQAYFNNTVDWWLPKFKAAFERVEVLDSAWADDGRLGSGSCASTPTPVRDELAGR
jgi:hypothetical protein